MLNEVQGVGPECDSIDVFSSPPPPIRIEASALPKALLTFDGANEQIEPIMRSELGKVCTRMNIALFKFAAACSLVQQPNDVSPCHKILHEYGFPAMSDDSRQLPTRFKFVGDIMEKYKFAPGHKKTFATFFSHLQDVLHVAFSPAAIRTGWTVSGLHNEITGGVDVDAIMSGWNPGSRRQDGCWAQMTDAVRKEIRSTFDKLADIGMAKGEITDTEIENMTTESGVTLKSLFEAGMGADVPDWKKIQPETDEVSGNRGVGVNLRRCILLSHPSWLAAAQAGRIVAGKGPDFDHSK